MQRRSSVVRGLAILAAFLLLVPAGCNRKSDRSGSGVDPIAVGTQTLPDAVEGSPYSYTLAALGGLPPYTWSLASGALPSGVSLASDGVISGTPTSAGLFPLTVQVIDSQPTPAFATALLDLTVIPALRITTSTLPDADRGTPYSATLTATGGVSPYTWTLVSGSLPTGLNLTSGGDLTGTPTIVGIFAFAVEVTDDHQPPSSVTAPFALAVFTPTGSNTPPELSPCGITTTQRGLVELCYKLIDMDGDPVYILAECSTDGGLTFLPATSGPPGEGTGPIQASPISDIHIFVWDSFADIGATRLSVILQLTPSDRSVGIGGQSGSFDVDNQPGRSIFTAGPVLPEARMDHTSTRLQDGTVLLAGGIGAGGFALDTAEIYSPVTGRSVLVPLALSTGRSGHTATLLADGRVLLAGGADSLGIEVSSAELYDPATGGFVIAGPMAGRRTAHAAASGAAGTFVTGGLYNMGPGIFYLDQAEPFDPTGDTFSPPITLAEPRAYHTAHYLANDRILLVGGSGGDFLSAEEFEPASSSSPVTIQYPAFSEIARHATALLTNGSVLVTGGGPGRGVISIANSYDEAFLYTSPSGFTRVGPMVQTRRSHTCTLLADGRAVVSGGILNMSLLPQADSEIFDPSSSLFSIVGPMSVPRSRHAATLLEDGRVLVTGGTSDGVTALDSADYFHP